MHYLGASLDEQRRWSVETLEAAHRWVDEHEGRGGR